ncbi:hypothetical protein BKA62DRAFT_832570 [Auriculariales sp. MPI-PUGE-AT-0066]|nr:hypothetical protein BKA62DRAFT_832570 [Auriculariales sp. MPI-PUGE-AT-0066]
MESDVAWAGVHQRLRSYEPLIRQFLQGDIAHPEWIPPHKHDGEVVWPKKQDRARIAQLRILKFGEQDRPDMLLSGLGSLDQLDAQFEERLQLFMSHEEHTVLWNTSGTGKTRMVFEVLTRTWGLYFTCASDQQTPYGSSDLRHALTHLEGVKLRGHPTTWRQPLIDNTQRAREAFNSVITTRLLVFQLFCDLVQSIHVEEQVARRKWLLLQLRSDIIFRTSDYDLFDSLGASVSLVDPRLVEERLATLILSPKFPLSIIAVDEANVASGMHEASYAMSDGQKLAPVLRELVRHLSSSFPSQRLIVSGTRIDLNVVRDAVKSGRSSQSAVRSFCALGSFDTIERTRSYLHHFLGTLSKAHVTLMHSWFQGRHRFLANCVEHLLMFGLNKLDAFIQMAVVSLTGYDTNNVEWEIEPLYDLIRQDHELSGSLAAQQLREALFAYALRNQQSRLWSNVQDQVSLGLALLDEDTTHASIWEPLVFYRLFTWNLNMSDSHSIGQLVKQESNTSLRISQSLSSISTLASCLYQVHAPGTSKPTNLSDYLVFQGTIPSWAVATADIILPPCTRTGHVRIKYPTAFSITAARHPEDVLHWLNGGDQPFLVPDDRLGADLMFFLRLKHGDLGPTAVVLVTLQLAKPSRSTRRPTTIVPIQPPMFYAKAKHCRDAVLKAIKTLPKLPTNLNRPGSHSYSMLRILGFAEPFRPPAKREPPVACLQVNTLLQRSHKPELDVFYLHCAQQKERYELDVVDVF